MAEPNSASSASARENTHCADCHRPLTLREAYLGETCIQCEQEYLHDTHSDDDYPRAA